MNTRDDYGEAWDGFDRQTHIYDERAEKSRQTRVWVVLTCVMVFMLLFLIFDQVKESRLMRTGNKLEAIYDADRQHARFRIDGSEYHIVDLSGYYPVREGDKVWLYYYEDPDRSRPQNTLASKVFYYVFFGSLLGICIWRIRKA
ncbi:MAG: hypothetical protein NC079_00505 [Clostridium sp.]|nr:hypothetical protein [Acetatifactor muris]MCM1527483.1 hypothetical protein [Bacteroides sp.]MCM1562073.1 hypothetical protein [Clostridium sp.]